MFLFDLMKTLSQLKLSVENYYFALFFVEFKMHTLYIVNLKGIILKYYKLLYYL